MVISRAQMKKQVSVGGAKKMKKKKIKACR